MNQNNENNYRNKVFNFGSKIKDIRKEKGFSVRQLAMQSGLSSSYISQVENFHREIPLKDTLDKWANGLRVDKYEIYKIAGLNKDEINKPNTNDLAQAIDNDEYTTYHGKKLSQDDKDVIKAILKKYDRK